MFSFQMTDGILLAVDTIASDYEMHARAAIGSAGEYVSTEKVLVSLLERAGL